MVVIKGNGTTLDTTLEEVEEADDKDDVVLVIEVLLVIGEVTADIEDLVESGDGARLGDAAAARTVTNGL